VTPASADRIKHIKLQTSYISPDTFYLSIFYPQPSVAGHYQSNSSMHHYECVALCKDISLHQRGRFCARSLAPCMPQDPAKTGHHERSSSKLLLLCTLRVANNGLLENTTAVINVRDGLIGVTCGRQRNVSRGPAVRDPLPSINIIIIIPPYKWHDRFQCFQDRCKKR